MRITWRRRFRLGRFFTLNASNRGASLSARRGRLSASSSGRVSARIARGLTWWIR